MIKYVGTFQQCEGTDNGDHRLNRHDELGIHPGFCRIINESAKEKLGRYHLAPFVLYPIEFAPVAKLQHLAQWKRLHAFGLRSRHKDH